MNPPRTNWPTILCTLALVMTPTWLAGQTTRSDPLGMNKGCNGAQIMDAIEGLEFSVQTLSKDVGTVSIQIETLQKTIDKH